MDKCGTPSADKENPLGKSAVGTGLEGGGGLWMKNSVLPAWGLIHSSPPDNPTGFPKRPGKGCD